MLVNQPETSASGSDSGSGDDDLSSSSLLDLMWAAVASSCKLSPALLLPGQLLASDSRGGWW